MASCREIISFYMKVNMYNVPKGNLIIIQAGNGTKEQKTNISGTLFHTFFTYII